MSIVTQALRVPAVFAVLTALVTATLAYALARVTEVENTRPYRAFFKTLLAGLVAGLTLAWLAAATPADAVATVPFDTPFSRGPPAAAF